MGHKVARFVLEISYKSLYLIIQHVSYALGHSDQLSGVFSNICQFLSLSSFEIVLSHKVSLVLFSSRRISWQFHWNWYFVF